MATRVVKVKREKLEACMTCPLCKKLLKEATTISLCLHTFCRKCIYEKLSDDEVDACPVCNIDLGALPVEKLRPDHNLQDIRAKIFPYKKKKVGVPETMPSPSLPVKRKERSLSSLVAPRVSVHSGLTGKRSKNVARKTVLRGSSLVFQEVKKEEDSAGDHSISSNSQDSLYKLCKKKRQGSSLADRSDQRINEDAENDAEVTGGKTDLWTPLNCLVEAANRSKLSKGNSQETSFATLQRTSNDNGVRLSVTKVKAESTSFGDNTVHTSKKKNKESTHKTKLQNEKNGAVMLPGSVKRKRLRAATIKRETVSDELDATAGAKKDRRNSPVWFTLVASEDQEGNVSLPQIASCYLRIKDGTLPVSFIQKYLVKKLDLASEAEVEILCRGQAVLPTLQLHSLLDLWFRTTPTSKRTPASVGASARDFVMVLSYCRRVTAT